MLEHESFGKVRHLRTKLAHSEVFQKIQSAACPPLMNTFVEDWIGLHRQLGGDVLSRFADDNTWTSDDELCGPRLGLLAWEIPRSQHHCIAVWHRAVDPLNPQAEKVMVMKSRRGCSCNIMQS